MSHRWIFFTYLLLQFLSKYCTEYLIIGFSLMSHIRTIWYFGYARFLLDTVLIVYEFATATRIWASFYLSSAAATLRRQVRQINWRVYDRLSVTCHVHENAEALLLAYPKFSRQSNFRLKYFSNVYIVISKKIIYI